jgi:hypothetical protein
LFQKVNHGRYAHEATQIYSIAGTDEPIDLYAEFLRVESARHNKTVPCEQTPRYLFFANEILNAFPEARMINIVRDPRDVLLSQKNKWRRRFLGARNIPLGESFRAWVNYHPYIISRLWVSAVVAARRMADHPRFFTVRFEDLVGRPEETVQAICAFADLRYEPGMLEVPHIGSSTGHDRPDFKGIDSRRSGNWRAGGLSRAELEICEQVTGYEMQRYGYVKEMAPTSLLLHPASMGLFSFKAVAALLLNLRRTRNLLDTLRRRLAN